MGEPAADLDTVGSEDPAGDPFDPGAAAVAGTILGTVSLLFLAGSQFVLGADGLRGSYDPKDALTIMAFGQLAIAVLALALSRYGQRNARVAWERSVASAGVLTAAVSVVVSAAAAMFVITR